MDEMVQSLSIGSTPADLNADLLSNELDEKPKLSAQLPRAPKPIPRRVHQLDPVSAWDVVKCGRECRELPVEDFHPDRLPANDGGERTLRFVCISDTHSKIERSQLVVPDGDVLLHAGDFTNVGFVEEVEAFAQWFGSLPHKRKILIAGNHDLTMHPETFALGIGRRFGHKAMDAEAAASKCATVRAIIDAIPGCEYLCDSGTVVEGIRIWGSPWQPEFGGWAFNLPRGEPCREKWRLIPSDADVVITHGPPLGYGDLCRSGARAGCLDLLVELQERVQPKYHVFGHIHESHGVTTDGTTTFINASTCDLRYKPSQQMICFDVPAVQDDENDG